MSINSNRDLNRLALAFEHLVQDYGNKTVRADTFRACSTEDDTFANGIRIGATYAYTDTALQQMLEKSNTGNNLKVIEKAVEILSEERSFQSVVNALNYLLDKKIIF